MKIRLLFLILLFANIVVAQQPIGIGIGTATPTESVDIATGGLRIRDLTETNPDDNIAEKYVTVNEEGVLRAVKYPNGRLFHANLKNSSQQLGAGTIVYLVFDTPLVTSASYSYDTNLGVLTFNEAGNYLITLQASFFVDPNVQLVLGVRPYPSGNYLGRASHYSATKTEAAVGVGEVMGYTTVIPAPYAGYQVRFLAASAAPSTVVKAESGTTGTGTVTNVTVQKI